MYEKSPTDNGDFYFQEVTKTWGVKGLKFYFKRLQSACW
jgi:hypothetical protein